MFESSETAARTSTKTGGTLLPSREGNFPLVFGRAARAIFPGKTAFKLAAIGKTSDRAAKDWLSGKVAPPAIVVAAMFVEVTRRD